MKVAAHVDERLHEHDEEGVHTEWERKQVVLPSRGHRGSQGAGSRGAHRAAAHQEGGSRVDAAAANVGRPRHAHRTYRATNSATRQEAAQAASCHASAATRGESFGAKLTERTELLGLSPCGARHPSGGGVRLSLARFPAVHGPAVVGTRAAAERRGTGSHETASRVTTW